MLVKGLNTAGGLVVFLLMLTAPAQAQRWQDYKCYLADTEGKKWVHIFEMDPERRTDQQAALPGRLILDSFGATRAVVDQVYECVPLREAFTSAEAGKLDNLTPR